MTTSHARKTRVSWLQLLIGTLTFGGSFYFGLHKQAAEMGVFSAVGLVLLAFTYFDQLETLKGGGMELKRVVQEAKTVTEEAEITIQRLTQIALVTSQLTAAVVPRIGRYDGALSAVEMLEFGRKIKESLLSLQVPREEVKSIVDRTVTAVWEQAREEFRSYDFSEDASFQAAEIEFKNKVETHAVDYPFSTAAYARQKALELNVLTKNAENAIRAMQQVELLRRGLNDELDRQGP